MSAGLCLSPTGGDQDRFVINNRTGEIRLTRAAGDRRLTPNFTLTVMVTTSLPVSCFIHNNQLLKTDLLPVQVCQVDDRLKYSVASVLVRVLCENNFPPVFNRTIYKGFIIQSSSPASIISTYGNQVLQVQVSDRDFPDVRTHASVFIIVMGLIFSGDQDHHS